MEEGEILVVSLGWEGLGWVAANEMDLRAVWTASGPWTIYQVHHGRHSSR